MPSREPYYDISAEGDTATLIAAACREMERRHALLAAAITYARRGWHILPCWWIAADACACGSGTCVSPGKHPIGQLAPHGCKSASIDEATVIRWWERYPHANVAIATGAVSGLVVLDVDPAHGGEDSLARLVALSGDLGRSLEVRTGGGGRHLYFRHPGNGRVIKNSAGALGPGLDVRGDGGYVVAPPSRTLKGNYGWLQ